MGPYCLQRRIRGREDCEHQEGHPVLCNNCSDWRPCQEEGLQNEGEEMRVACCVPQLPFVLTSWGGAREAIPPSPERRAGQELSLKDSSILGDPCRADGTGPDAVIVLESEALRKVHWDHCREHLLLWQNHSPPVKRTAVCIPFLNKNVTTV